MPVPTLLKTCYHLCCDCLSLHLPLSQKVWGSVIFVSGSSLCILKDKHNGISHPTCLSAMCPGHFPIKRWRLSTHPTESAQALCMLWTKEYGGSDAVLILGTALTRPRSFHFPSLGMLVLGTCPSGTQPACLEQPKPHENVTRVNC